MLVNFEESLLQVQRLLGLLPGVEVSWVRRAPSLIRIGMAISSQESLACLAHLSFAANVLVAVETISSTKRYGDPCDPNELRYELRFPKEAEPGEPPTWMQVMGIFLARELKARQLLDPREADQLQVAWNAVPL